MREAEYYLEPKSGTELLAKRKIGRICMALCNKEFWYLFPLNSLENFHRLMPLSHPDSFVRQASSFFPSLSPLRGVQKMGALHCTRRASRYLLCWQFHPPLSLSYPHSLPATKFLSSPWRQACCHSPGARRLQEPLADAAACRCHVLAASGAALAWVLGREAGSARERCDCSPMGSAHGGSGGCAVRGEGGGPGGSCWRVWEAKKAFTSAVAFPWESVVAALFPSPPIAPQALVCARPRSRSSLALRTEPPAACVVRTAGGGRVRGGAGVRCWGLRHPRERGVCGVCEVRVMGGGRPVVAAGAGAWPASASWGGGGGGVWWT